VARATFNPSATASERTAVSIRLTAAREITATVAVAALTAGKAVVYVFYVQGD
jgi:hypothetical protein